MQSKCATVCCREYGNAPVFGSVDAKALKMTDKILYTERISSNRTTALFVALALLFLTLSITCLSAGRSDVLATILLCLFVVFVFYSLNFRTLTIQLTAQSLKLTFGVFTWIVCLDNVAGCSLDEIPMVMRMGGAGIHFMFIRKRYRVSFNFLEYPRVVIAFKQRRGPVKDISFTTRRPDEILRLIREIVPANSASPYESDIDILESNQDPD